MNAGWTSVSVKSIAIRTIPSCHVIQPPQPSTIHSRHRGWLLVTRSFHLFIALYLAAWAYIYQALPPSSVRAAQIYAPSISSIALVTLSLLFVHAACGCSVRRSNIKRRRKASRWVTTTVSQACLALISDLGSTEEGRDMVAVVFNIAQVASQSLRVVKLAENLVSPVHLVIYASLLIVYALASPAALFHRNATIKGTIVNVLDFAFGFTLSCCIPAIGVVVLFAAGPNAIQGQDNAWYTRLVTLSRMAVVSSPVDFVCQVCMHLGTYVSLTRLQHSIAAHPRHRSKILIASDSTLRRLTKQLVPSKRTTRRAVVVNAVLTGTWGFVLTGLVVRAVAFREICPSHCTLAATPLFDLSCSCLYANVNCHVLQTQDVDALLDPVTIGTRILVLQLARCDVPRGIDTATLAPHQALIRLAVLFSHMTQWDATLPASVGSVNIRFSHLDDVPSVLTTTPPPYLSFLHIDSTPLWTIDVTCFGAWPHLERLVLTNVSLATFPEAIATLSLLYDLNLRANNLTTVPMTWQFQTTTSNTFRSARFNGNQLEAGPWTMVRPDVLVDVSSNPISSAASGVDIPSATTKRQLVLDDTPLCRDSPGLGCTPSLCAPGCYGYMQRDYHCDPVCWNQACSYDGGDCDGMGFDHV
ncbi:Aste57867_20738 [Aphanomyces stellatus]|uniref:Aste57867_20738 protein n=1 Tax=Aphanomyces stellatus TaxID=120398 RepID=A0A485LFT5_9STRA|nr:hypothetical protein As57867_020670 [Aphanomyces stellatus]VFT97418.1 Aste57867_20738 [Aphanomyces stellatus]